jgi:hypothetical protein
VQFTPNIDAKDVAEHLNFVNIPHSPHFQSLQALAFAYNINQLKPMLRLGFPECSHQVVVVGVEAEM